MVNSYYQISRIKSLNLLQQIEFFDIPCPCVGVCTSGPSGHCVGCFRSREERQHWFEIDNHTKYLITQACQRRKLALIKRKKALVMEQLSTAATEVEAQGAAQNAFDFDAPSQSSNANDLFDSAPHRLPVPKKATATKQHSFETQLDLFSSN